MSSVWPRAPSMTQTNNQATLLYPLSAPAARDLLTECCKKINRLSCLWTAPLFTLLIHSSYNVNMDKYCRVFVMEPGVSLWLLVSMSSPCRLMRFRPAVVQNIKSRSTAIKLAHVLLCAYIIYILSVDRTFLFQESSECSVGPSVNVSGENTPSMELGIIINKSRTW